MPRVPRWVLFSAVGAPVLLIGGWTLAAARQPDGYDSTVQTITPTGPAVTEFHVSKPDGWPQGSYRVEVFADGEAVGAREFEVR